MNTECILRLPQVHQTMENYYRIAEAVENFNGEIYPICISKITKGTRIFKKDELVLFCGGKNWYMSDTYSTYDGELMAIPYTIDQVGRSLKFEDIQTFTEEDLEKMHENAIKVEIPLHLYKYGKSRKQIIISLTEEDLKNNKHFKYSDIDINEQNPVIEIIKRGKRDYTFYINMKDAMFPEQFSGVSYDKKAFKDWSQKQFDDDAVKEAMNCINVSGLCRFDYLIQRIHIKKMGYEYCFHDIYKDAYLPLKASWTDSYVLEPDNDDVKRICEFSDDVDINLIKSDAEIIFGDYHPDVRHFNVIFSSKNYGHMWGTNSGAMGYSNYIEDYDYSDKLKKDFRTKILHEAPLGGFFGKYKRDQWKEEIAPKCQDNTAALSKKALKVFQNKDTKYTAYKGKALVIEADPYWDIFDEKDFNKMQYRYIFNQNAKTGEIMCYLATRYAMFVEKNHSCKSFSPQDISFEMSFCIMRNHR